MPLPYYHSMFTGLVTDDQGHHGLGHMPMHSTFSVFFITYLSHVERNECRNMLLVFKTNFVRQFPREYMLQCF